MNTKDLMKSKANISQIDSSGALAGVRLDAKNMVAAHQLSDAPLVYIIGSFDKRVTVLAQQTRALNLAWQGCSTLITDLCN